ncbi:MAG: DUF370 domain-containing protein [Clostridia bacterium]|nr:DUF370 domain-containing protein [Clostridia bacterium]MBQ3076501.1 DUF370 domain-containing protein [Clostridia bacterium]
MYLHLGRDVVVRLSDVVAILDMETATVGPLTRDFLKQAERELRVTTITDDIPKSFVLTVEGGTERVYLSQIAPATLEKRVESGGLVTDALV